MKRLLPLAASLLAGCGSAGAPVPQASAEAVRAAVSGSEAERAALADLYAATRKAGEPQVTVYVASVPEELKSLTDAFGAAFPGVRLDFQRFIGEKLSARLDGEFASGQRSGDVLLQSSAELRADAKAGRLERFVPPTLGTLAERDPAGNWQTAYRKAFVTVYNTRELKPDDVPRTVPDVLASRWAGRFGYPFAASGGPADIALEAAKVSDAQLQAFARNGVGGPASSELIPSVAQGRYAFALWTNGAATLAQQRAGAPLALAFSPGLDILMNVDTGILAKAPHPNAARLFVAWLQTPKAQGLIARLGFYPAMPGAPIPQGYPPASAFLNGGAAESDAQYRRVVAFGRRRATVTAQ